LVFRHIVVVFAFLFVYKDTEKHSIRHHEDTIINIKKQELPLKEGKKRLWKPLHLIIKEKKYIH